MEQEAPMSTEEKRQLYIQCLYDVAAADGTIDENEAQAIELLRMGLGVEMPTERIGKIELTDREKCHLVKEMYRLSIIDGEFHEKEGEVIDNFCKLYDISDEIYNPTKDWALAVLEAENKYKSFIKNKFGA